MEQLTRFEIKLALRGLELLQSMYESEIDDCTRFNGYEDSDACRRAEIGLSQTHELIARMNKLAGLTVQSRRTEDELAGSHDSH